MLPTIAQIPARDVVLLDLFSTSEKSPIKCHKNAPYLCIPPRDGKAGSIYQLCCNDWLCPRCGELRARHEYGRIIEGIRLLNTEHDIYFMTITCENSETTEQAEAQYKERTHRLLTSLHYQVKKAGGFWCYVQVTERQKRGHPHSHLLMTCKPPDAFCPVDDYAGYKASIDRINPQIPPSQRFTATPYKDLSLLDLHSEWLMLAAVKAGLGVQARISQVDLIEGAARYVAKYLFKSGMFTEWRAGWRRIRYAQSFPKLPDAPPSSAFPLLTAHDWQRAADIDGDLICRWQPTYEKALSMGCYNVLFRSDEETNVGS